MYDENLVVIRVHACPIFEKGPLCGPLPSSAYIFERSKQVNNFLKYILKPVLTFPTCDPINTQLGNRKYFVCRFTTKTASI